MNERTPFLTQYYFLISEWKINGIDIDNATEGQALQMQNLQKKAIEQSGLSLNELILIMRCRSHNIFKKINIYSQKLIDF